MGLQMLLTLQARPDLEEAQGPFMVDVLFGSREPHHDSRECVSIYAHAYTYTIAVCI